MTTAVPQQRASGKFSTGLFDCLSDSKLCCLTCWCPCITFGRIAEIVDRGTLSCRVSGTLYTLLLFTGFHWVCSCTYRVKLKSDFGIPEDFFRDCYTHCCCEWCALCQEYRELERRGYYPELGWDGNKDRLNAGITMRPQIPNGMTR